MVNASQIEEHFEVVGSDGHHVGRVDHVLGDTIELAKMDIAGGFKHHLIPVSWAERIEENKVFLSKTADQAKSEWREKTAS
ncbi:DUF2171 domain-containing protein [soil metagenome]